MGAPQPQLQRGTWYYEEDWSTELVPIKMGPSSNGEFTLMCQNGFEMALLCGD